MTTINQPQCPVADKKTISVEREFDGSLYLSIGGPSPGYGYFDATRAAEIVAAINSVMKINQPAPAKARPHGPQEYKGNGKHAWEKATNDPSFVPMYRLRVPGGWLYGERCSAQTTFVPMPTTVGYGI